MNNFLACQFKKKIRNKYKSSTKKAQKVQNSWTKTKYNGKSRNRISSGKKIRPNVSKCAFRWNEFVKYGDGQYFIDLKYLQPKKSWERSICDEWLE